MLEDEDSSGAHSGWRPKPRGLPVCNNHVAHAGRLPPPWLTGHHGDDDVGSSLVGASRDDAGWASLHPAEIRVREGDEHDVAPGRSGQLRRGRLGQVVVDGVLFREPVRGQRRARCPRRPDPAEEFLTQFPELTLGRLDSLLRHSHLVGVVHWDRLTRLQVPAAEPLVRLDDSHQLAVRSLEPGEITVRQLSLASVRSIGHITERTAAFRPGPEAVPSRVHPAVALIRRVFAEVRPPV